MHILKDKKALVFKLKQPQKITTVIPTAVLAKDRFGEVVVAVPHRPDETKVLRNIGFTVPDPMPMYYEWPGQFSPFKAQIETASFLTMETRCFCLNSMGTGKTISSLWAFDYLRHTKQVKKALVTCPLSTMDETWAKEVFRNFPHLQYSVVYGSRAKRLKALAVDADIYIVNHHGLETIREAMAERPDIDLILVDELTVFRNASTDLWKSLNEICNKQHTRRVWGLTGAPIPHEPTDAWAQIKLVRPDNPDLPKYFGKFRDMVMRQVTAFKWLPREDATDTVFRLMRPSIRFALDDCTDLPPQTNVSREVKMTPEQETAYKQMLAKLKAEYDGGEILAVNEAIKAGKLLQISLGVAYAADNSKVVIPSSTRMAVLRELIEESEGKVIVFVPLTGALESVASQLSKEWTTAVVHGETPKAERDRIFREFQETSDPHVLVANPKTMSHGLTLTAATTIVWYGPTNSNDVYVQACARVRRPGQTRTTVVAHIVSSDLERRVFQRLQNKQSMQNILLDMFKGEKGG